MAIDLAELNDNQRQAVAWNDGPMLVLASPGSGKTRVLATRITRLVEGDADASILALTFTNKAAAEMRARVDQLLGRRAERAHLATFHSYASEVLRQHGAHVDVNPDFQLLAMEEDRLALLEPVAVELENGGHDVPTDRHGLLRLIDHLFRESFDGGAAAPGLVSTPKWLPLLFKNYCAALRRSNRQDFGSLLHFACRLLREKAGVARLVRAGWSHVCVDEFQDTNKAQYELLKLIAPPRNSNLFIVGDDDQIIYQWNGASPERLQTLRSEYDLELVQLPENYRCPSEIVELANNLIPNNKLRSANKLPLVAHKSRSEDGKIVRYREFVSANDEAEFVATDIKRRGADASESVVLARTSKLLVGVGQALERAGLTPYLAKSKNDFEAPPLRVVLSALRLANARHDRELLRRLCVGWEMLTGNLVEVDAVVASSTLVGGDFLRAWAHAAAGRLEQPSMGLLAKLQASLVDRLEFPGIVDWFVDEGWKDWAKEFDTLDEEIRIWIELHANHLREYPNTTLHGYLQSMDLVAKVAPPAPGAVRCLTVHAAKGLEFKHVYVVGMAQEVLPSFQALRKGAASREIEEERRNCFVAITRAKETLTLTRAKNYYGYAKGPSQFLAEMAGRAGAAERS